MSTGAEFQLVEVGHMGATQMTPCDKLEAGEVDVCDNAEVADVFAGHQVSSKSFQISQILPFSLYTRGTRRASPQTIS